MKFLVGLISNHPLGCYGDVSDAECGGVREMPKGVKMPTFDEQLAIVQGKIYAVNVRDDFERRNKSLLYYWSSAEPLFQSAKIIWNARGPSDVAAMLIHVAFDKDAKKIHNLLQLCTTIGISVN